MRDSAERLTLTGVFIVGLLAGAACRRPPPAPCCIELLNELRTAEVRPQGQERPPVVEANVGGSRRRSVSVPVPTRMIFRLRIPSRAIFTTALALENPGPADDPSGVVFRLGFSDGRVYEQLLDTTVLNSDPPVWRPITLDLSAYAGWQWSLFYRPSSIEWQVVLNTYAHGANAGTLRGLWAMPSIQAER